MRGDPLTAGRRRAAKPGRRRRSLDGVGDAVGERQRLEPRRAGHDDVAFPADGAQEALELERQRLGLRGAELHVVHDLLEMARAHRLPARLQLVEMPGALREVEGEVSRRLEDAQRARALRRHAARRHQGHRAVGELDPGVRDVHMGGQERRPRRPHLGDVRVHQLEHEIEVVDHEVEDHRDVGAPRLERGQPLALQEPRALEVGRRAAYRAIEPLHVPHLQRGAGRVRGAYQALRALQRVGERLLDQRGDAAGQHGQSHLGVRPGGHDDRHGFDPLEQGLQGGKRDGIQLAPHLVATARMMIVDAHQLRVRQLPVQPCVVEAEGAGPDDADAHPPRGHTMTPRWEASMKERNFSTSGRGGSSARARAIP